MSIGGIFYSLYLAYISFFILEVLCLECMAMYLANIVIFVFLFASLGIPLGGARRFVRDYVLAVVGKPSNLGFKPKLVKQAIAIGVVFLLGWLAMLAISAEEKEGAAAASIEEKLRAFYMRSLHDIKVDPAWAVWGNPEAEVTIVEFSEYQCPFCRIAAFSVKPFLQEFKDEIRYYFVNFPLDSACNEEMTRAMHPQACFASKAGICAQKFGRFWKFHDELFREQSKLSRKRILDIAEKMGMARDLMQECIDSPETRARLKEELEAGHRIYVSGTPSIYLDGRKLRYWRDPKFLRAVVEEEIEKSSR
jgi:protein-disulfide isomerase